MGGIGSGRWYRGRSRTTCEEVKRIDIRYLKQQGLLRPYTRGSLSWSMAGEPTGTIDYQIFSDYMLLNYKFRRYCEDDWEPVRQTIHFDTTRCHYGGSRKWFLCPRCDARVGVLYGADVRFLCRHCYRLPYASQGEGRLDRMHRKLDKISEKLEADEYVQVDDLYKPKGMHWKTFYRLKMAEISVDDQVCRGFIAKFGYML